MDDMTGGRQPQWAPGSFMERLTPDERDGLLSGGVTRSVSAGRQLLVEDWHDRHVEVIREGYVKVTTEVGGAPRLLAVRLPGDIVGEFAAVTSNGRSATVTAGDGVIATVVRQRDFLRFLERRPGGAARHGHGRGAASVGQRRLVGVLGFSGAHTPGTCPRDTASVCGTKTDDGVMIQVPLTRPSWPH
jgi:CRP/FNR family cyclic AMP-dependent transcriptional regulator